MKKITSIAISLISIASLFQANYAYSEEKKSPLQKPHVYTIEKNLFVYINKERKNRNLSLLNLSPELSSLARKHSQDMANNLRLSHLSSSRKSYIERLEEEGFYFIDTGENVAFSETFQAEFIHQSLMESADHRENILYPNYDQAGIGVIYNENKGYYITQDFLQSLEKRGDDEAKELIQKKIDEIRETHSLLPLLYRAEADEFARVFSMRKAEKKLPPPIPDNFGETHIASIATPSLAEADSSFKSVINTIYATGGVGVQFARNKDYPGGAYFITLLLFPESKYMDMGKEEFGEIVLQTINKIRQKNGLEHLKLDEKLSKEATQISLSIMAQKDKEIAVPPRKGMSRVFCYVTEDPYMLPPTVQEKISNPWFKKIGIGTLFGKTQKFPKGAFWVTIILEESSK